jgi:hypothetical protein
MLGWDMGERGRGRIEGERKNTDNSAVSRKKENNDSKQLNKLYSKSNHKKCLHKSAISISHFSDVQLTSVLDRH